MKQINAMNKISRIKWKCISAYTLAPATHPKYCWSRER